MSRRDVQLDLFGEVLAGEDRERQVLAERDEWRAGFDRANWIAPYDTSGGLRAGESRPGWRCPDPDCGEIEPNGYLLLINHGWDPDVPGRAPFDGRCHKVARPLGGSR